MLLNKFYQVILYAVLLLSLSMMGCKRDETPSSVEDKGVIYLSTSVSSAGLSSSYTRAQSQVPSVNSDSEHYEDYVKQLVVLVYDATKGRLLNHTIVDTHNLAKVNVDFQAVDGDKYHLCFLANYPDDLLAKLVGIMMFDDMVAALKDNEIFIEPLYDGATADICFPMSRIYKDQTFLKGVSTPDKRTNFDPNTGGELLPVSSFKSDIEAQYPSSVNLIRTAAKVSLSVSGDLSKVDRIEMHNLRPTHTYMEHTAETTNLVNRNFEGCDVGQISTTGPCETAMYIPENLVGSRTDETLYWDTVNDEPIGGIAHITVVMKDGSLYNIPIISNGTGIGNYLDEARGKATNFTPNYSIIRNYHYSFQINVPTIETELDIKVLFKVSPWIQPADINIIVK